MNVIDENSLIYKFLFFITKPLSIIIDNSCPDCRIFSPSEDLYWLTFVVSFIWITLFSYCITIVTDNWVNRDLKGIANAEAFFGIVLVAIGAEVPDTINSCTVAARGYGSMSTSSCIGS